MRPRYRIGDTVYGTPDYREVLPGVITGYVQRGWGVFSYAEYAVEYDDEGVTTYRFERDADLIPRSAI